VVPGELAADPDTDHHGDGHSGGKAKDIDKGVAAVFEELAEGNVEIIFEHALNFRIQQNCS